MILFTLLMSCSFESPLASSLPSLKPGDCLFPENETLCHSCLKEYDNYYSNLYYVTASNIESGCFSWGQSDNGRYYENNKEINKQRETGYGLCLRQNIEEAEYTIQQCETNGRFSIDLSGPKERLEIMKKEYEAAK